MSDLDLIFLVAVALACEFFNSLRLRRRVARQDATLRELRRQVDRLLDTVAKSEVRE